MSKIIRQNGQVLVGALLLMMLALIMIPLLVMYVQNEAKWTVKQSRSGNAYHLAESAQERAVFYLVQSTANWSSALSGTPITGFSGDVQYSDVAGGLYTIYITSGPLAYQATITTKGRDTSNTEVRTIKAIYSGSTLNSGWIAQGSVNYTTSFNIFWGQLTSYTSIADASAAYHPIKVAKGAVSPWDSDPTAPNSDSTKGYIAYDPSLTDPATPDFAYYRAKAKATIAPNPANIGSGSNGGQTAPYLGTGYFDGASEVLFKAYTFDCSTCVFFIETGKAKTDGAGYLKLEAMIVYVQNIHIHSLGANPYVVSVPTDAWKQYAAGTWTNPTTPDTSAVDEYPGDGGYHAVKTSYTIPNGGGVGPLFDTTGNTGMSFHGFLYSYSFNCGGGTNVNVGSFLIGPGGSSITTMIIYFDPAVAGNVKYTKSQIVRASWDEILSSWP